MEAVGERQNVNLELKISRNKILELRTENECFESEKHQILVIEYCQNLPQAQNSLDTICLENFPNIFVITLQVLGLNIEELEKFVNFLLKKVRFTIFSTILFRSKDIKKICF